ncbi:MAG: hypothetical protein ABW171_00870 [Steroidobacter sp.]
MDFRKISTLSGLPAIVLIHLCAPAGAAEPGATVSPSLPTFATLLAEYERRFLVSASKTEHTAMVFISSEAPAIAQSVLGSNWPLVREEAIRLLNELPVYDTAALDGREWAAEFDDVFEPFALPTPAHLATGRLWNPEISLSAVVMTVVPLHLAGENIREQLLIASNVGMHSYRATWRGKTALVSEYGFYLVAMEYMLTKEGMFVPVRAAIARRQL